MNFTEGIFQFIYDFENFIPNENATIIGIENAENFRWIAKQKYLFEDIEPLFVSRYPQSQSKDLVKWLQSIPNNYLHFGDFDFAGIGIYLNEFKKHLLDKATFFIPEDIEKLVAKHGNKNNYNRQKVNFEIQNITEEKIVKLIKTLHQYKCGLEQEIFIKKL
jgi:putative lipoic acid-binding regulatory protein